MIYKHTTYANDEGVLLIERQQVDAALDSSPPTYHADVTLSYQFGQQQVQAQVRVEVPGATLAEAFTNAASAVEAQKKLTGQKIQDEMQAQHRRLVIPGAESGGPLNRMRIGGK